MTPQVTQDLAELEKQVLIPTYPHNPPIALVRGRGARVWDAEGREYLDFLAGIAVCSAGHSHPAIVEAVQKQAAELMHVSNIFLIPSQVEAAKRLVDLSFADQAFFCNSGTEAIEGAFKLARRYQWANDHPERTAFIAAHDSFHGRTLGAVTATGTPKYHEGFGPMLPQVRHATFNDLASFQAEIDKGDVAAVVIEPIQGEGGIIPATQEFISGLREACTKAGALLIFDEIQCGLGRTGKDCAYQNFGVEPDIMTHAKALGNGFPVGAFVARKEIAAVMTPGTHATTYGGNPLATAVASAYLKLLVDEKLSEQAEKMGKFLRNLLREELGDLPVVKEVRGLGLMIGIDTTTESAPIVPKCAEKGLLLARAGKTVVRLVPPLIITEDDCREAVAILKDVLSGVEGD